MLLIGKFYIRYWKLFLPLFLVIGILAIIANNTKPKTENLKETSQPPNQIKKHAASLYIEDIGGPHVNIGVSASVCQPCHALQYNDWKGSPHAAASTDPRFAAGVAQVKSLSGTNGSHCYRCHMYQNPLHPDMDADPALMEEGVNCIKCHSKKLNAKPGPQTDSTTPLDAPAPNSPEFCARCHNQNESVIDAINPSFDYQGPAGNPYIEWKSGPFGQQGGSSYMSCLDCHGQSGSGTIHRWPTDKIALLKRAYTFSALQPEKREGGWRLGYLFKNSGAGHMLPTGDPGRMITIEASVETPDGTSLATGKLSLSHLVIDEANTVEGSDPTFKVQDNRLTPGSEIKSWITVDDKVGKLAGRSDLVLKFKITYGNDPVTDYVFKTMSVQTEPILIEEGSRPIPALNAQ